MILLQGRNLTKYYGAEKIFEDVNFVIKEGEKVGLVGPNGAGKTTLFKCILGEEAFDQGDIIFSNKYTLGYLEQIPEYPQGTKLMDTVLEMFSDIFALRDRLRDLERAMGHNSGEQLEKIMDQYSELTHEYEKAGGFSCEAKARKIIKGLGFSDEDFNKDVNTFSGGQKTRVSLARLLVREPDLLLLDEPTNHLDLNALEWLESFLKSYPGAVLFISHDRYFLDEVVTRILELEHNTLRNFPGNYSKYILLKEEQDLAQKKAFTKQQKEIKKTEEYIRKYKAGIKSKQARGREKQLARLDRLEDVKNTSKINLNFKEVDATGDIVLAVEDLAMGYNGQELFSHIDFTLRKGEKVALIGLNGTGKSTILKIIVGKLQALQGKTTLGSRVKVGYFDQEHRGLTNEYRVLDEIMLNFNMNEGEARDYLALVLFQGDDVLKRVSDLSGGEKGRLTLLKLIIEKPNLLIMDEPTNHLDILSKEIVEDILIDFPGTLLIVSHDRYFLDRVTERTLELEEGRLKDYLGNYSYYRAKKLQLERDDKEQIKADKKKTVAKIEKPKINKSKLREEIKTLELDIEELEKRIEVLNSQLADPETYQDEEKSKDLVNEYRVAENDLPKLYEKWEELVKILEENSGTTS